MSGDKGPSLPLPQRSKGRKPWWDYAEPEKSHGRYAGDTAEAGLVNRAVFGKGPPAYRSGLSFPWGKGLEELTALFPIPPDARVIVHTDDPIGYTVWVWPEGSFYLEKGSNTASMTLATSDVEFAREAESLARSLRKGSGAVVRCLSRPQPTSGYSIITLGSFKDTYVPENYTRDVAEKFERLLDDLTALKPRGRMAIIHGPPGTGKTYLLKAITQKCKEAFIVYVPNTLTKSLGDPELIEVLSDARGYDHDRKVVLLVEDADIIFRKRGKDNQEAISSALNMSDGILGELMEIYIVGTTNVPLDDIDDAIKRPGRLSENIHVGLLPPDQVLAVYRRIVGDPEAPLPQELEGDQDIASIYLAAQGSGQ